MRALVILLLISFIAGCTPTAEQHPTAEPIVPTLFPTATPEGQDLSSANLVALNFLEAWKVGDFDTMYSLVAFTSQEAHPFETFKSIYQAAHTAMTLENLTYTQNGLLRESPRVALYNYDVTFTTTVLGEFTDAGRDLRLVIDEKNSLWRVAWTPGDVFKEMQSSGVLRLERFSVNRGNIYDRTGEVVLAHQQGRVAVISVIKSRIPDYVTCADLLVRATGRSSEVITAILNQTGPDWDTEVGTIEPKTYVELGEPLVQSCNATFRERLTRLYPLGSLAPNVIGYVGYPPEEELPELAIAGFNQDSILGRSGIEASWDEVLRGKPGGRLIVVSPDGRELREVARTPSQPQQSVWLTLDANLQQYALQVVNETYAAQAGQGFAKTSKGAAVVILDVNTGEILAMVSYPTYDGNALTPYPAIGRDIAEEIVKAVNEDPRIPLLNRATQGVYPSGSVMKIMDTLAVLDSGVYTPDTKYTCNGGWSRDIPRFDWLQGGHGTVTVPQALTGSCNPFYYEVGYQMDSVDPNLLPSYAKKLGLGVPTGLTDVAESPGLIPDPEWMRVNLARNWTYSDAVNMSIGQGQVQVTPLQIARLTSIVANGGILYRPQLVKQVGIVGDVPSYTMQPEVMSEVGLSAEAIATVRQGMCAVTTNQTLGTAEFVFRDSDLQLIGVCGKTGTAEDPANLITHAWFTAYAPRENPEIAIAVIVENAGEGSGVAAPIVRRILEYYFFEAET